MDVVKIKRELNAVIKKHENDKHLTFETNISAMAKDCLKTIEYLEDALDNVVSAYHDR